MIIQFSDDEQDYLTALIERDTADIPAEQEAFLNELHAACSSTVGADK